MVVDQLVNNVEMGYFHARMIAQLRSLNPQANIDAALRQELTNGFQSVYFPPTANTVGVYFGGDNTRKIMYLDGVASSAQGAQLIAGYQKFAGLQAILDLNIWIRDSLPYYISRMSQGHLQATEYVDFVGYSAGGAIATGIMYELARLGDTRKRKCITFGAPRAGGPTVRDVLSRSAIARWFTPDDPIPLVPPRLQDAPQFATIIPPLVFVSWSNFVHTRGGIQIHSDGTTSARLDPSDASVTPGTSLADWLFGLDSTGGNPHSIQHYINYFQASQAVYVTPREKLRPEAAAEQPGDDKKKDVNRQRDRVVTALGGQQREQNGQIVNQPIVALFKPIRMGRIWAVTFGDKIVAQGVREDTCRHLCRAGNDFLRSLPKQGLVDPITLASQFESFLAYATAAESDWVPKLATNLDLT